ncbi:MAG: hypothetical protein V1792_23000 [Pseudomonadota bacterium]
MIDKDETIGKTDDRYGGLDDASDLEQDTAEDERWLDEGSAVSFSAEGRSTVPTFGGPPRMAGRLERIKQSHSLLKQFTPKELKVLMNLKRNTSPKAWTLREDLVVLTLHLSNREIAELLKDRNKEAVKKRLQLLRSKGLAKRQSDGSES